MSIRFLAKLEHGHLLVFDREQCESTPIGGWDLTHASAPSTLEYIRNEMRAWFFARAIHTIENDRSFRDPSAHDVPSDVNAEALLCYATSRATPLPASDPPRFVRAIEYLHPVTGCVEGQQALDWLKTQVDYLGGRVLTTPPRVQVFFDAEGVADDALLPDGCKVCMVPTWLLNAVTA